VDHNQTVMTIKAVEIIKSANVKEKSKRSILILKGVMHIRKTHTNIFTLGTKRILHTPQKISATLHRE